LSKGAYQSEEGKEIKGETPESASTTKGISSMRGEHLSLDSLSSVTSLGALSFSFFINCKKYIDKK
jgi:hypothetical protein